MEAHSKTPQSAAPPSSSSSPQSILHHQSHSYSSYPPHHHHHQYPPPPPPPFTLSTHASPYYQQHQQQSPFTYSGSSVPQHSYPNGHYHQPRQQLMQHVTSPSAGGNGSASWPDVPPTTTTTTIPQIEQMDTTTFGSSNSKSRTPSPLVGEITEVTDAASALETLAHAASFQISSSSSYSPTLPSMLSSAGPLKKRRKVLISGGGGSDTEEMMKDTATMEEGARGSKNGMCSSISTRFPNILHSLLTKGNSLSTETDHNDDMSTSAKAATAKEDDNNNIISSSGMEWLHHGKSFRILRYDVLCDEILPKEFVGLCSAIFPTRTKTKKEVNKEVDSTIEKNVDKSDSRDDNYNEDGKAEKGREDGNNKEDSEGYTDEEWIESFLWHLRSYGYEEIMIGREKGSFRHEMFVRESPELCNKMKMTNHQRQHTTTTVISQSPILAASLTPTFSTIKMIGSHSPHPYQGSSTDNYGPETTYSTASWASKRGGRGGGGGVSSIFKPRRSATNIHHPSHLNVPMLSSTNTASLSFSDTWMNEGNSNAQRQYHHQAHHYHHNFPPRPPPLPATGGAAASRSPKTIRFRDEETKDDMAAMGATMNNQVSPSPQYQSGRKQLSSSSGSSSGGGGNSTGPAQRSGFVSRRGRRPPMISRHATH